MQDYLEILEWTLQVGHMCPTAPDTLGKEESILNSIHSIFFFFINDFEDGLPSRSAIFAGDKKLCKVINTEDDNIILQRDLGKLEVWAEKW